MAPDLAIRRERDAHRPALDGDNLHDPIGLRVDDDDAIVVAVRVIELVGARLNLQIVTAAQQQIDFLGDLAAPDVVDHHSRNVGVFRTDVQLRPVGIQRETVRRRGCAGWPGRRTLAAGARRERCPLEKVALDPALLGQAAGVENLDKCRRRHGGKHGSAISRDRRFVRLVRRDELMHDAAGRGVELVDGVVRVAEDDERVILRGRGSGQDQPREHDSTNCLARLLVPR